MKLLNVLINRLRSITSLSSARYCSTPAATKLSKKRQTYLERISIGPGLNEFINIKFKPLSNAQQTNEFIPYLMNDDYNGEGRKVHFEVYGCQMNTNDAEVVWSILKTSGYEKCSDVEDADVILIVTCAIRENAEAKIWNRLKHLKAIKKRSGKSRNLQIAVLGCMAERLKHRLLEQEKCVDVISGPDSYKDLPRLLCLSRYYQQSTVNVLLSLDETYADVMPIRLNTQSPTAFVSIMRGCDNMCSYCIVPFTRGRERSRPIDSIVDEVRTLRDQGIREINLLGQNVNSYRDTSKDFQINNTVPVAGFRTVYKPKIGGLPFSILLETVAKAIPDVRIRFTSPHPKDFSVDVLQVIRDHPNICKHLHLPAQSGNSAVLERMRRGYTREAYLSLVDTVRNYLPEVGLSSDFICGFCGETEDEFRDTLSLMEMVRYNVAYLFKFSMREKTTAYHKLEDDVLPEIKAERLQRMIAVYRRIATELHLQYVGQRQLILIEGKSKRSDDYVFGRNEANIKVIVPIVNVAIDENSLLQRQLAVGDFVVAKIVESNSQVLKGQPIFLSSIQDFYK